MNAPQDPPPKIVSERAVIALIGGVQFINILDFMMVMPLGPDFAKALDIPASQLGLVGGSYTASAAVAGIAGAFFLDRFDRRKALGLAMLGLVLGTLLGAFAVDLKSLLAARIIAGAFGGPATSVALSIIADVVPAERRGRAMGAVMGAFSIASILGVPAGLELARLGTWRTPFIGTAALGLVVTVIGFLLLPPLRGHIAAQRGVRPRDLLELFTRPLYLLAYAALALSMMSAFSLIPNISAHVQQNLHYPRDKLGLLYLVGGVVSFGTMRLAGRLVDKVGTFRVNLVGVFAFAIIVWAGFILEAPPLPLLVLFPLFMVAQTTRNVAMTTLVSKTPAAHERAGFMSLQSAVQHLAGALGAIASSRIITDGPNDTILRIPTLGIIAIALAALTPPLVWLLERGVEVGDKPRPHQSTAGDEPRR